jgi:hypothetical protein
MFETYHLLLVVCLPRPSAAHVPYVEHHPRRPKTVRAACLPFSFPFSQATLRLLSSWPPSVAPHVLLMVVHLPASSAAPAPSNQALLAFSHRHLCSFSGRAWRGGAPAIYHSFRWPLPAHGRAVADTQAGGRRRTYRILKRDSVDRSVSGQICGWWKSGSVEGREKKINIVRYM